jgi:hypothetical protein
MTKLEQIVKRAKQIRLAQPNKFSKWTDYVKYASKDLADKVVGKKKTVGKANLLPFPKEKKQTGKSNIAIDRRKQAMAPGKRKASPAAKKPYYYESRANRSDKGKLLGTNKIGLIEITEIGTELFNLEFKIRQLQEQKKVAKLISSKKAIAEEIKILQSQFKTLRAYLNTRAKFINK